MFVGGVGDGDGVVVAAGDDDINVAVVASFSSVAVARAKWFCCFCCLLLVLLLMMMILFFSSWLFDYFWSIGCMDEWLVGWLVGWLLFLLSVCLWFGLIRCCTVDLYFVIECASLYLLYL